MSEPLTYAAIYTAVERVILDEDESSAAIKAIVDVLIQHSAQTWSGADIMNLLVPPGQISQ
jgi:hypothetical protein